MYLHVPAYGKPWSVLQYEFGPAANFVRSIFAH